MCKSGYINQYGKLLGVGVLLLSLSACELLKPLHDKQNKEEEQTRLKDSLCMSPKQQQTFSEFCDIENWMSYMFEIQAFNWPERKSAIDRLGEDNIALIKKVLLSQSVDTPYNNRLRAQNWIIKVSSDTSDTMSLLLNKLIFANSQQLLEFESAITILSRVNARQEKEISTLQLQLQNREQEIQKQEEQVEKLLKIETDLSKQNRQNNNGSMQERSPLNEINRSN